MAHLKDLLDSYAARYNVPAFVLDDPVQFPRLFSDKRDIEIASLLVSTIAWGKRSMICRNATRLLQTMEMQPYRYLMDGEWESLPDANIHRTFFSANLRHYLRGLREIYRRHGSLEDFARACGAVGSPEPAWVLARGINAALCDANGGCTDSRCLPLNLNSTALKRLNMALRWLVRDDGIVDIGVWKAISLASLFIPLDVHVGNVSRALGLLDRRANDRRSVLDLTAALRRFDPADPVRYDFALFGIGVNAENINFDDLKS